MGFPLLCSLWNIKNMASVAVACRYSALRTLLQPARAPKKTYLLPITWLTQRTTPLMKNLSSSVDLAENDQTSHLSFASLFESSKFARILNPVGKKVEGEVMAVIGDKLYIDFGCKFHAVVRLPEENADSFVEGTKVVVLVKDLEMSMHPLGSSKDLSLLEAEAELCGLADI